MALPKLTRLELQILDALWNQGACSVREIQESFPEPRPAYTTIQTTVYRLAGKGALRCVKRISNPNIFQASNSPAEGQSTLFHALLAPFRGRPKPVLAPPVHS